MHIHKGFLYIFIIWTKVRIIDVDRYKPVAFLTKYKEQRLRFGQKSLDLH